MIHIPLICGYFAMNSIAMAWMAPAFAYSAMWRK